MKWFYNLKIFAKLMFGFLIVAFIAAFLGLQGIANIKTVKNSSNELYNQNTIGLSQIAQVQSEFLKISVNIRTMALVSKDKMSVYNDRIKTSQTTIKENMEKISGNLTSVEQKTNYNNVNTALNDYLKEVDKISTLAMGNGASEQLAPLITASDDVGKKASELLQNIYDLNLNEAKQRAESNTNLADKSQLTMIIIIAVALIVSIVLGLIISNIISKPINKLLKALNSISEGNLNVNLDINTKDEIGYLASAFEKVIGALRNLVKDSNMIAQAAIEGNLSIRADANMHNGDYRLVVEGINNTLNAISEPLNESKKILSKMAVNDLSSTMTGSYKGTMKEFAEDINSVHTRITDVLKLVREISVGDTSSLEGLVRIGKRSENDKLMPSIIIMMTTIQNLVKEVSIIADSAAIGNLEVRSDDSKFQGGYQEILGGFNKALDAIEEPINESRKVLAKMALNDLTMKMTGSYEGTMKEFAADINSVQTRILHTVGVLTSVSVGDTSELEALLKVGMRSENDKLMPAIIIVMTTIQNLIKEASMIADSAANGNLESRSDATKFQGGYREILDGFNKTLDAIEKPINESRKVLAKMAVNDLTMTMIGSYKGTMNDFAEDINSVHTRLTAVVTLLMEIAVGDTNSLEKLVKIGKRSENDKLMPSMIVMMTTIENLVTEASMIAASAVEGNLKARSDESKFQGGYRQILEGFNKALDAVEEPIKEASEVLMEMAEGNLCVVMEGNYLGSYKVIKDSLNHTLESFNELLGNITVASDQVLSGSTQVSDGSQALSQGTTEQASSIEELTSSITEVAAQTKQNAVNASQANELALNAKEGAILGNSHMKEMLTSMEEINESSSNISKIIKVIDDIAFQTNILALNAAVEAARAGQHGKGFAVVAEEVRNLAARSANAAKETTDLIEGSIKKVEFGTKIANNTAESLDQIVIGVSKAATLVGEIAAASNEQATAIYQINKGIEQVSDVVQTNSSTAEQSAAASEELSSQASMLKNMVGKFRLVEGTSVSYNEISKGVKKKHNQINNRFLAQAEAAVTQSKPKISLSNKDFGKY